MRITLGISRFARNDIKRMSSSYQAGASSREGALASDVARFSTFTFYGQGIFTVVEYPSLLNTRRVP